MLEYVLSATLIFTPSVPPDSPTANKEWKLNVEGKYPTLEACNAYWQRRIINEGPKYKHGSSASIFKRAEGTMCEPREKVAAPRDPRLDAADAAVAEILANQKR